MYRVINLRYFYTDSSVDALNQGVYVNKIDQHVNVLTQTIMVSLRHGKMKSYIYI